MINNDFTAILDTPKDDIQRMFIMCAKASRLSHASKGDMGGTKDVELLKKLVRAGDEHAKSLRGITVIITIDAPRYFWHEFVTYRMGCEQLGSESTMHGQRHRHNTSVTHAQELTGDIHYDKSNIPEGLMQERIFSINYQALRRMYKQRRNHKLIEWQWFCDFIKNELPYSNLITEGIF